MVQKQPETPSEIIKAARDKSDLTVEELTDRVGITERYLYKVIANLLTGEHAIPIEWRCMQLKDGIDFAEFLVDVTCKIHRFQTGIGTCGGPIDTLLITKDYSKWIKHKILAP